MNSPSHSLQRILEHGSTRLWPWLGLTPSCTPAPWYTWSATPYHCILAAQRSKIAPVTAHTTLYSAVTQLGSSAPNTTPSYSGASISILWLMAKFQDISGIGDDPQELLDHLNLGDSSSRRRSTGKGPAQFDHIVTLVCHRRRDDSADQIATTCSSTPWCCIWSTYTTAPLA